MRHRGGLLTRPWPSALLQLEFLVFFLWTSTARKGDTVCVPAVGCLPAYAFYRVQSGEDLSMIGSKFGTSEEEIFETNPGIGNSIITGQKLFIPFSCDCINDQLIRMFPYQADTDTSLSKITSSVYGNLTQPSSVAYLNGLVSSYIPASMSLQVPVICSCGNPDVSSDYGRFVTYPVVAGTGGNISGIATDFNTTTDVLKKFNKYVVWDNSQPTQYAFIPVTDVNGTYPLYKGDTSSAGRSSKLEVIVGAVVLGAIVFFPVLAFVL